jgi:hypothetical protein
MHKELAQSLTDHGEHFFKGKELMDAFGFSERPQDTQEAICNLLSMTKWMRAIDCQLLRVGFRELDRSELKFSFTYCIQSIKHDTDPLLVNEVFRLEVPLLALASDTARIWNHAYQARPVKEILKIAKGL